MEPEKKATRFVNKHEYVDIVLRRLLLNTFKLGFKWFGVFCGATTLVFFLLAVAGYSGCGTIALEGVSVTFFLVMLFLASDHKLKVLNRVALIPYANTADLPADESLVRASQEPVQEQQSILLRPTMEADTSPPEQLLRASLKTVETKE